MSKLERISAFIAVIEEHGFAAAARKLHISTAAVSRKVANLEAELGAQLLRRTTRQVALTEVGEQYYQQCKKALAELSEAEAAILGSQQQATGILSITSNRYFAIHYLLPHLSEFMAQNPLLQIKFELAERFPDLAAEGIDILFGVSIEGTPDLVRKRVATTRYIVCAAPSYLKRYGTPELPHDLSKHRYITHTIRKPNDVVTFKNDIAVYVEPILYLNDSRVMRECAIQGMGIVKLHDYMVNEAITAGTLQEIFTEFQEPQQSVYLYYQHSRYLQPKIRKFIDFYSEDLRQDGS